MLGDLNAGVKRLRSITGVYGHLALTKDAPRIDAGIHQMNSASGLGNAGFDSLPPSFQPSKSGK